MNKFKGIILPVLIIFFIINAIYAKDASSSKDIVSVLYFENTTRNSEYAWLSKGIADMLISEIVGMGVVDVVERENLKNILNEHELALTGLMDDKKALELGKLLNANKIIYGSFIIQGNAIVINGKLTETESGKITATFSVRGPVNSYLSLQNDLTLKVQKALRVEPQGAVRKAPEYSLQAVKKYYQGLDLLDKGAIEDARKKFEESSKIDPNYLKPHRGMDDICEAKEKRIDSLLYDLSSPDKIRTLVKEAVQIPFEGKCAKIHFAVMRSFKKYDIDDAEYEAFLMKSIAAILQPSMDNRAYDTLEFITRKNINAPDKWDLCLRILKKSHVNDYRINRCLEPFVHYKYQPEELEAIYRRIDQYFLLLKRNEIGLPKPLSFNEGFIKMLDAVEHDNAVSLYCYSTYKDGLSYDKEMIRTLNHYLPQAYLAEKNKKTKLKILNYLCEFFNAREMDEKLAEDLYNFTFDFNPDDSRKNDPDWAAKVPPAHLKILLEKCKTKFCKAVSYAQTNVKKKDRIDFCIEHNIECASNVPTPEACRTMLASKDWSERVRGIELLSKMGGRAKIAESAVIKALERTSRENERESAAIHRYAAMVLGNIKSTDPKALSLLISSLGSLESYVPEMALDSLVSIGSPAVPYLIKSMESEEGSEYASVQYRSAKALGCIGHAAKPAVPALRRMLKSRNKDIAQEALEEIGE